MDWGVEQVKSGIEGLLILVGAGMTLLMYRMKAEFLPRKEFADYSEEHDGEHEKIVDRLDDGDNRFVRLETRLEQLPNKDDVFQLRVDIAALTATIQAKEKSDAALTAQVQRLVDHHMRRPV